MNIAFHYYAVKALASCAGFKETEAQIIAEYSQFVDDYNTTKTILANWAPREAIDMNIAEAKGDRFKIDLVTTGFGEFLDYINLMSPTERNKIVVPFHFILHEQMNRINFENTTRPAIPGDTHLVNILLENAVHNLIDSTQATRRRSLIHLGMLLHIFADTYAHQRFSGHRQDSNKYVLQKAIRHYPQKNEDETQKYKKKFEYLPAIGHAMSGHAPDDTYIYFKLYNSKTNEIYERDNTECFMAVAENIYNLLCLCSGTLFPKPFESISKQIFQAFYADNESEDMLQSGWKLAFPDVDFYYSKESIMYRLFLGTIINLNEFTEENIGAVTTDVSEEFYHFTLCAAIIREMAVIPELLK